MDNKKILEALQMQPLSEDEKAKRHILGRLYGPIATTKESTRNGRKYNAELWNKALNDEVFKEKIANKSLFLELGHPTDREETDMTKVCACIPEMPKVVDGDLYAYVDILDTTNGQLLKKLCDYGFIPGISSRGSGDIMANNEVDPETFYLECWDVVQLPAVKKARLAVCESLDRKSLTKALKESLDSANDADRKIMEEALENLNMEVKTKMTKTRLKEAFSQEEFDRFMTAAKKLGFKTMGDIDKFSKEHGNITDQKLLDELEKEASKIEEALNEVVYEEDPEEVNALAELEEHSLTEEAEDEELEASEEEVENTEEVEEDSNEEPAEDEAETDEQAEKEPQTVKSLLDELKACDKESTIEFAPIIIDGAEYEVTGLEISEEDDNKVVINVNYSQETDNNIDAEEAPAEETMPEEEIEEESEEVSDAEADDEVIESLKEMVRQKDKLESEVKSLKSEKTVSDAKVEELKEEVLKYKNAFERVGGIATKAKGLEKEVKALKESLTKKDEQIKTLNEAHSKVALKEVNSLKESLTATAKEAEKVQKNLTEQVNTYKSDLNESIKQAEAYKAKCNALFEAYVSFRAQMLGVRPAEITNRLNEKYTIEDINRVCDSLLTHSANAVGMPFGLEKGAKVRINESKDATKKSKDDFDFDSLYELAGLK